MTLKVFDPTSETVAPHRQLWLAAKPIVRRAITRHWAHGVPPNEMLVVIADAEGIGARILKAFFAEHLVEHESDGDDAPVVAVLVGVHRQMMIEPEDEVAEFFGGLEPNEVDLMILGPDGPALAAVEVIVSREKLH